MIVYCACQNLCAAYRGLWRLEGRAGVIGACESCDMGAGKANPGPLQMQPMLLTPEPAPTICAFFMMDFKFFLGPHSIGQALAVGINFTLSLAKNCPLAHQSDWNVSTYVILLAPLRFLFVLLLTL